MGSEDTHTHTDGLLSFYQPSLGGVLQQQKIQLNQFKEVWDLGSCVNVKGSLKDL